MKGRRSFFSSALCGIVATVALLGGCGSAQSRAQDAFGDYQSAQASGDLTAARSALLKLVAIDDGNPSYWTDLGKIQLQLGQHGDAYYAFNRAHELDKSDIVVLGILIRLALMAGDYEVAEERTRLLVLLSPTNPVVQLTEGFLELRRGNFDQANARADLILQSDPYEPSAKLLKARVLLDQKKLDDAIALLSEQVRVQPNDSLSLRALVGLYDRKDDWRGVAQTAEQLFQNNPTDYDAGLLYIEASFRASQTSAAHSASLRLLEPNAPADIVDRTLSIWVEHWKEPGSVAAAIIKAATAGNHQRLAYATFFNAAGAPERAAALVGNSPQHPVSRINVSANAIFARSLAQRGREAEARNLFDAVLSYEPDHVYALRGRAELYLATRSPKAAIRDAQRLVSISPTSAPDRLLLARAYAAAGDRRHLERTLWNAFHQIPAERTVYAALHKHMLRQAGIDAARRVTEEFEQQRNVALDREFV